MPWKKRDEKTYLKVQIFLFPLSEEIMNFSCIWIDLKEWITSKHSLRKGKENNAEREIWSDSSFMFVRHTTRTPLPNQNIHREHLFTVAPVFTSTLQRTTETGLSERGHTFTKDHVYVFPESPARTGSRFVAHVVGGRTASHSDRSTANLLAWACAVNGRFLFSFWFSQGLSLPRLHTG